MTVSLIVAHDENYAIGLENKLLWSIPEDMRFFKKITTSNVVVMGRNTFDSIGRLLPDRTNIILTRSDLTFAVSSKSAAIGIRMTDMTLESLKQIEETYGDIFIIGGAQVYKQALDLGIVDYIFATEVEGKHTADTFLPFYKDNYKLLVNLAPKATSVSGKVFEINLYERRV